MKILKIAFFSLILITLLGSCQKETFSETPIENTEITNTGGDDQEVGFRAAANGSEYHPYYLDIYKELKKQDENNNFSESFVTENGTPLWDETLIYEADANFVLTVSPLVNATEETVEGLIFASKVNGVDYFNLVTKTGLYAELEGANETHPEIDRLYNSLVMLNHFGLSLYCQADEEYIRLEENIFKVLEIQRTEEIWIVLWDPDCTGVNGNSGGGRYWVEGRIVVGYPGDNPGQYSVNGNWDYNNENWSTSGGGGSTGNNSSGGNLAFFQQLEHFVQTIAKAEVSAFSQQHGINIHDLALVDIIDINCYETIQDEGIVIGVSLDSDCAFSSIENWISTSIGLNAEEISWLSHPTNQSAVVELANLLYENDGDQEGIIASNFVIDLLTKGLLNADLDNPATQDTYYSILESYEGYFPAFDDFTDDYYGDALDPIFIFQLLYTHECIVLKYLHPEWDDRKVSWQATKNILKNNIHSILDMVGIIPGLGEPADFINGVVYLIEGDGVNASLSFGAMVPFAGWGATGLKYAGMLVVYAGKTFDLKVVFKNGIATFGNRSKLREILDITDPLQEAHHLIPWGKRENTLVQLAAHADEVPYHMNHPKNGIPLDKYRVNLPDGVHANHPHYDQQVETGLSAIKEKLEDDFDTVIEEIDPDVISGELIKFQYYLRDLINANSGVKINLLDFNYVP